MYPSGHRHQFSQLCLILIREHVYTLSLRRHQLPNLLAEYAAQLGSDCPFFIYDNPCHATGRGEILSPIPCNLSDYTIVLVHPGIHVSTAWAFGQLTPHAKEKSIATIVSQPMETWKEELINDFEAPIFVAHPYLAEIKAELYQQGAIYAGMSGSGSSLFGLFPKGNSPLNFSFDPAIRIDVI